jgi:hypothetical protein
MSGWDSDKGGSIAVGALYKQALTMLYSAGAFNVSLVPAWAAGATHRHVGVLRNAGQYMFLEGGNYSGWTLAWVEDANVSAPLYAAIVTNNNTWSSDHLRVADLPAPFNLDVFHLRDTVVAASDTFTHPADCSIQFDFDTLSSGADVELWFRIQDATNYMRLAVQSDGTIDLDEVVDGTPNELATDAAALSGGERVAITAYGTSVKVDYDGTSAIDTTASNFTTATDGELDTIGTGGAISDLDVYALGTEVTAPRFNPPGIATQSVLGFVTDGQVYEHEADFVMEFVMNSIPGFSEYYVIFREQDVDNHWMCWIHSDGRLRLYERVATTLFARISAVAGTVSDGDRVVIVADDETITVYVANIQKGTYSSASNFKTATSGRIDSSLSTGEVMSNLIIYPRTMSGQAKRVLDKYSS